MRRPSTRLLREERGSSLAEVLVALTVTLLVFGVVSSALSFSREQNRFALDRVDARDDATKALERMKRDVRQALAVDPAPSAGSVSTGTLRLRVWGHSPAGVAEQHWIRYDCDPAARACTRSDETLGGAPQPVLDGVGNADSLFTVSAPVAPSVLPVVALRIERPIASATNPLVLETTVTPRNCQDGLPMNSATCDG